MYASWQALVPEPGQPANGPALVALIPALAPLATTPQDPVYHAEGDVWTHTLMVCQALTQGAAYQAATAEERFVLFYAAVLHDLAKPACTRMEDDGRITSKGHSGMGAVDARIVMWRAHIPFAPREAICRIIEAHQVPFFALETNRKGQRPEFIAHTLSWKGRLDWLCAVAEADMRGRVSAHQAHALDNIALFQLLAEEEGCWTTPQAFADAHTRLQYVRENGRWDLATAFHQPPGSRVTVMAGLPASGKDTWAATHRPGLPMLSFDAAKARFGIKPGDEPGKAVHWVQDQAKALLREHAPFVWNATHLSPLMRQKTLGLLHAYGAHIELVYLEQPPEVLYARNRSRDTTLPNAKIDAMLRRWDLPSVLEAHEVTYLATVPTV